MTLNLIQKKKSSKKFTVLKMSDNYILKLSVKTEAEKYLALLIPQRKLNCYCFCNLFISKDFSLRNVTIFQVFALEGIYWSFSKLEKVLSHRIAKELLTLL